MANYLKLVTDGPEPSRYHRRDGWVWLAESFFRRHGVDTNTGGMVSELAAMLQCEYDQGREEGLWDGEDTGR